MICKIKKFTLATPNYPSAGEKKEKEEEKNQLDLN